MNNIKPSRLSDLKVQATFLLKHLRTNTEKSLSIAEKFLQLPGFAHLTAATLIEDTKIVKLKHAYLLFARESGFTNWPALKSFVSEQDCLYHPLGAAYIHYWFKEYEEATEYFQKHGGYLLTFWKDFIVCGEEYVELLNLLQYQSLWKKIGHDWVKPRDRTSWLLLKEKAIQHYLARQ